MSTMPGSEAMQRGTGMGVCATCGAPAEVLLNLEGYCFAHFTRAYRRSEERAEERARLRETTRRLAALVRKGRNEPTQGSRHSGVAQRKSSGI